jgi:CDP-diacylglycerol--serine O-phosphatidyltransferase
MFNIPNLFTAANLLAGILAVLLTLMGRIDLAPWAIFAGAFFDFFDGFLARKMKLSGELGKQLDSFADMITFGLAPGFLMLVVLVVVLQGQSTDLNQYADVSSYVNVLLTDWKNAVFYGVANGIQENTKYIPFIALFIPFMSMFRLAKFNIDTRQSESFIGLPTPANTIFFTTFPLILTVDFNSTMFIENWFVFGFNPYLLIGLIILMSLLLVSEIPLFSLKFKNFSWGQNKVRFIFLISSLILIPLFAVWSIPLIVILYLILSWTENTFVKK